MRYVDTDELLLPDGWHDRANAAAAEVAAGLNPDERSAVWRELKDPLAALFPEKKCWYCECPVDRSDNAVDHFRPKSKVSDAARAHAGYRWLAFDATNFRYSCTFCNSRRKDAHGGTSGGKGDRFPLLDETQRVYSPGPTDAEQPLLLDPCEWSDWELLGCKRENGDACPTSADPIHRRRADTSIDIYHLNYRPTSKQRHAVAVRLLADVEHAKRLFEAAIADSSRLRDFKLFVRRIHKAIHRHAPFSGEMIFLLRGQRHPNHPWIQQLLEA